ncbi:MAG: hypothetical protein WC119_00370 [Synergistaceae bacterium]
MNNREKSIQKIRRWLKKNDMTYDDIGGVGQLSKASDEIISEILEDIAEDEAKDMGRRYEEQEALKYMSEEDSL